MPILIIISLFLNGYIKFLGVGIPLIVTRNSIFTGLPMFAIGFLLKKHNVSLKSMWLKIVMLIAAIGLLGLSLLEAQLVVMEFYITSILSSICFLLFFVSLNAKENKFTNWFYEYVGKNVAFNMYVFHIFIGAALSFAPISPWPLCILIFLASLTLHEIVHLSIRAYAKHKEKKNEPKL